MASSGTRLRSWLTPDLAPLRGSRDLRLLVLGNFVTRLGTQASLVALPYPLHVQTRSPLLTGLLGAAEPGPLVLMALLGGALSDAMDRRRLLLLDQIALVAIAAALALLTVLGGAPLAALYVLGGLLAGFGAVQNVARSAIVPNLVAPEQLRGALAVNFGLYRLTMVVARALGGHRRGWRPGRLRARRGVVWRPGARAVADGAQAAAGCAGGAPARRGLHARGAGLRARTFGTQGPRSRSPSWR